MKASLKIEAIGDNTYQYMKLWTGILNSGMPGLGDLLAGDAPKSACWVAQIVGFDPKYKYARQFVKGKKDYAHSNSKGSRGVFIHYLLESGYVYEVLSPATWKRNDRYFCAVTDDGEIQRIDKEFVNQWIKDHSASQLMKPQNNE
jgi:hypothetical protein